MLQSVATELAKSRCWTPQTAVQMEAGGGGRPLQAHLPAFPFPGLYSPLLLQPHLFLPRFKNLTQTTVFNPDPEEGSMTPELLNEHSSLSSPPQVRQDKQGHVAAA